MTNHISYKRCNRENILNLVALYRSVFKKNIDAEELEWRFLKNPALQDHTLNYCAVNEHGNIVGHTAFIPVYFFYRGRTIKSALSVGSMVSNSNAGIFPKLYADLERLAVSDGFDLLFAFPNSTAYPFFVKLLRYTKHYFEYLQLNTEELPLNLHKKVPCQDFRKGVFNPLSNDFLTWRIYNCPVDDYKTFKDTNFHVNYKFYLDDQIDLISINFTDNYFDLHRFQQFLSSFSRGNKVNIYSSNVLFSDILVDMGFKKKYTKNKLLYKSVNPDLKIDELFLQMIDNDIF